MRVLVAEDDVRLSGVLDASLAEAGWDVDVVNDGPSAYDRLMRDTTYDVVLLDWMLPGLDGVSVARKLRTVGISTPIMMLTAKGDVRDRIHGLDSGADDYLPKPFDLDELLARLRALCRRTSAGAAGPVQVGDLLLDPATRRVSRHGVEIVLSAREFDILYLLMSHAGQVVTRFTILDEVWDGETDLRSNVIDVHLAGIRAKIDYPFDMASITTLRGVGYRFEAPVAAR